MRYLINGVIDLRQSRRSLNSARHSAPTCSISAHAQEWECLVRTSRVEERVGARERQPNLLNQMFILIRENVKHEKKKPSHEALLKILSLFLNFIRRAGG